MRQLTRPKSWTSWGSREVTKKTEEKKHACGSSLGQSYEPRGEAAKSINRQRRQSTLAAARGTQVRVMELFKKSQVTPRDRGTLHQPHCWHTMASPWRSTTCFAPTRTSSACSPAFLPSPAQPFSVRPFSHSKPSPFGKSL